MSFAAEQIRKQDTRMQRQRLMWASLAAMLNAGQYAEFWERYADHLEESGAVSDERKLLVRAHRETAEALKQPCVHDLAKQFLEGPIE